MYRKGIKRLLDIAASLFLLPFLFPVCLVLCLLIWIEDGASPFYNAERLGKNGSVFHMYKLRTMQKNAPDLRNPDGSTFNAEDDPRLTRSGKWVRKYSLDELPQVLNILKGDMSFIGPRPDLPSQKALYEGNEAQKLSVRPGLTGYAQAYGRNAIPWKKRIQLDIYYANHITFLLDAKILLKTVSVVIKTENIYTSKGREM